MLKLFAPTAIALSCLVTSADAAGIHDFNPSNVGPRHTQRQLRGDCYRTRDNSRVCWFRTNAGTYSVAIHDTDYPAYPAAMSISCVTGKWQSYSGMPKQQMSMWARLFCNQR